VPESPSEITALRFQPAKLIVFREMAFQSHFSSVKVVAALGKFNSGKQQQFSDFAIWRLQHFVEKRDWQLRKK
jgi:hypothetical protein